MIDDNVLKLEQRKLRLEKQKAALESKRFNIETRLQRMEKKCRRQSDHSFKQLLAITLTCLDYAWLRFLYPNITIRSAAELLNQPKSTFYDRISSVFGSYDMFRNHLRPLANEGSYHLIRIIFTFELLHTNSSLTLKGFCDLYSLKYHTIRQHIKKEDAELIIQNASLFYLLAEPTYKYPFSISKTHPQITSNALENFYTRWSAQFET